MKNELQGNCLIDKDILEAHKKLKWWVVPFRITVKLAAYAACVYFVLKPGYEYSRLILVPFMALILATCKNVAHFYIHYNLRNRKMNRVLGIFWSSLILQNFSFFKYEHLNHHRFAGVDGDTIPHKYFESFWIYIGALAGVFDWRTSFKEISSFARNRFPGFIKTEKQKKQIREDNVVVIIWFIIVVILTILFPKAFLLTYWLPICLAPGAFFIFAAAEHYGLNSEEDPDIAYNTRTVKSSPIVRFIQWNSNYHAEHHYFPNVPLLNLHSLSKHTNGLYYNKEKSYFHYHIKLIRSLFNNNKGLGISRSEHESEQKSIKRPELSVADSN